MEFKALHLKIESKKTYKFPIWNNKVMMKTKLIVIIKILIIRHFLSLIRKENLKSLWILNRIWINMFNKMIIKTNSKLNKKY